MRISEWSPAQARWYDSGPKAYDPQAVDVYFNGKKLEGFVSGESIETLRIRSNR